MSKTLGFFAMTVTSLIPRGQVFRSQATSPRPSSLLGRGQVSSLSPVRGLGEGCFTVSEALEKAMIVRERGAFTDLCKLIYPNIKVRWLMFQRFC